MSADRWNQTIHITFIDDKLNSAAIHDGTVSNIACRVMLKVEEHHHDVKRVSRTSLLGAGSQPVELVYEHTVTLDDGVPHYWRHYFRRPDYPWSMALDPLLADTTLGGTR